jgi:Tfp pilus assembly protein PilO
VTLTTRRIGAISGAVVLAFVVIWYAALFRPQQSHLKSARVARAAAESALSQLKSQMAILTAEEKQVPAEQKQLAALDQSLPDLPNLPDALQQLHQDATSSGVTLSSVGPGSVSSNSSTSDGSGSSVPTLTVTLDAMGTYQQVVAFLHGLTAMTRTLVITNCDLTSSGVSDITASLTTDIFYADSSGS